MPSEGAINIRNFSSNVIWLCYTQWL